MGTNNRFAYNPLGVGGIHLANATRYAILAREEIARAFQIAASLAGDGAAHQANLEGSAEFGVTGTAGQAGPAVYSAISSLQTSLNAIDPSLLGNLDQGG